MWLTVQSQRIEPYGWDREDRTYFVLDDNRIYRLTEPPQPPSHRAKSKKKPRKLYGEGSRSSKRNRGARPFAEDTTLNEIKAGEDPEYSGLGGMEWECVAVTLGDVQRFLQTLQHSRDENEKILRAQIQDHLIPILEQQEESRRKKALQRERDLLNLAKMANAKRSTRIAGRLEQRKREDEEREEEVRREARAAAMRREEKQRHDIQRERDQRLMSRERRLKDRETRRLRYQEDIAQMSDESKTEGSRKRASGRQLQQAIEQKRQALLELGDGEDWVFDCVCGVYGHVDDGTHSIACGRCNVWQHSKCIGIAVEEADRPDFHYTCASCRSRDAVPKPEPIKAVTTLVHASSMEDQLEALGQSLPPKPSQQETVVAGGEDPIALPKHLPKDDDGMRLASYPDVQEPGLKGPSPLPTPSLFNGAAAPSPRQIFSGNAIHYNEPSLPPPSGGVSPVKHTQNITCNTPSASRSIGLDMSSTPTLPPTAHPHIPTPPVKVSLSGNVGKGSFNKPHTNSPSP